MKNIKNILGGALPKEERTGLVSALPLTPAMKKKGGSEA